VGRVVFVGGWVGVGGCGGSGGLFRMDINYGEGFVWFGDIL